MSDVKKPVESLNTDKLVEAAQTALNCLVALRAAIADGATAAHLSGEPSYWPLSLLKYALGDEGEGDGAKTNWENGEYVGPVPEEVPAVPVDAAEVRRLVDDALARCRPA